MTLNQLFQKDAQKAFYRQLASRGAIFLVTCYAVAVWQDSTAAGFATAGLVMLYGWMQK